MGLRLRLIEGEYWLRPSSPPENDLALARQQLCETLLADGDNDDVVSINFVGEVGLEKIFDGLAPVPTSMGWEGLIVPFTERRTVRLPAGITVTPDATDPGLAQLLQLRTYAPWILHILKSPFLSLADSLVIRRDNELIGWIPVWRPSASMAILRLVVLRPDVHEGEERRRTHLQLGAFSRAIDSQCSQNRSVVCWMPDDGDAVNALKVSIAGAVKVTHWMSIRVRRDLAPVVTPSTQ